jgi:hypothetical protein
MQHFGYTPNLILPLGEKFLVGANSGLLQYSFRNPFGQIKTMPQDYSTNAVVSTDALVRSYKQGNPPRFNQVPEPSIVNAAQRLGSGLVDIDFTITDRDSPSVKAGLLAFNDGRNDLGGITLIKTFVEGTGFILSNNVAANITNRVTWDAVADITNSGFADIQFEILAKDEREVFGFRFITVPAGDSMGSFKMSDQEVTDNDFQSIWYWMIATRDSNIQYTNKQVRGKGGNYDGKLFAVFRHTFAEGRLYWYNRWGVRSATDAEIARARSGRFGFKEIGKNSVVKLP